MFELVGWVFLIAGSLRAPWCGEPTVILVPGEITIWVSLPEADIGGTLIGPDRLNGILGAIFTVKDLQAWVPEGERQIIRVMVNRNGYAPTRVLGTVKRFRSGWNPKAKANIFLDYSRMKNVFAP